MHCVLYVFYYNLATITVTCYWIITQLYFTYKLTYTLTSVAHGNATSPAPITLTGPILTTS